MGAPISLVPGSRRQLLTFLKNAGWSTIPKLARALSISTEAVRQQLSSLEKEGWVISNCGPDAQRGASRARGRPPVQYCLSAAGDDLFAKSYSQLAVQFFDSLADPVEMLADLTDARVRTLHESASGREDDATVLRSIYRAGDPYLSIEKSAHGYRLVERNCPYLSFAMERPLFCSSTVSALRRITGCEVVRENRFQDGDGRCVFHIRTDRPLSERRKNVRFEPEPAKR